MTFMSVSENIGQSWIAIRRAVGLLTRDLYEYYFSPYPFLLLFGTCRRIWRRLRNIWLPKGKGRPPVREDLVDLILDMKRSNWSWGALRISQELGLLGISIHKKTVQRILQENGLVPPKTRIAPPTWTAFLKAHKHLWALDFTCLMDFQGLQMQLPSNRSKEKSSAFQKNH